MTDQTNGAPAPQSVTQKIDPINAVIQQTLQIVLNGLVNSMRQLPAHAVFATAAFQLGHLIANEIVCDLKTHFELRAQFKEAFEKGIAAAQLHQPDVQPGAPMTAMFTPPKAN